MRLLLLFPMFVRMLSLETLNPGDRWILALPQTWWDGIFSLPKAGFGFAGNWGTKTPSEESQTGVCRRANPSLLLARGCLQQTAKGKAFPMNWEIPGSRSLLAAAPGLPGNWKMKWFVIVWGAVVKMCLQFSSCGPTCLFWCWALGEEIDRFWSQEK